jgi:hypothetical protein
VRNLNHSIKRVKDYFLLNHFHYKL